MIINFEISKRILDDNIRRKNRFLQFLKKIKYFEKTP
jgi:hypothetical protein